MATGLNAARAVMAAAADEAFAFGANDCCTAIADACVAGGLADPMAPDRGRYRSAGGFLRHVARSGHDSLAGLIEARFDAAGTRIAAPEPLAVAIIAYGDGVAMRVSPSLCLDDFWWVRTETGLAAFAETPPVMWRLG